jgi:formate/nitrite transporter FocA (FNT family)
MHILFDSGASFSFVSDAFVAHAHLFRQKISQPIVVNFAKGFISSALVCPGCFIFPADETFVANLVVIPLESFDAILGMDWLSQYRVLYPIFER